MKVEGGTRHCARTAYEGIPEKEDFMDTAVKAFRISKVNNLKEG